MLSFLIHHSSSTKHKKMTLHQLLFYFFAGLVVASALVVLFTRNILNAAFSLIFTFLGIAAIYVLAGADFIAITQIIVYVGGILVLMVFGVMLSTKVEGQAVVSRSNNLFLGVLAGLSAHEQYTNRLNG